MNIYLAQSKLRRDYVQVYQDVFVVAAHSEGDAEKAIELSPHYCPEPEFILVPLAHHAGEIPAVLCKTKG